MSSAHGRSVRIVSVISASAFVLIAAMPATSSAQGAKKGTPAATATATVPHSATARCGDKTWSSAATQQGACAKHGGVAKWFGKAPKDATARCKDGEYWTAGATQGACSGHDGVAYRIGDSKKGGKKGS